DSFKPYGGEDSYLLQILPDTTKIVYKTRLIGYQRLGCNQTALTYETGCFEHPRFLSTSGSFPCGTAGHLSSKGNASSQNGIIYSNFTLKTARRGLLIGHQPLVASAVEIDEGFTTLRFASSRPMKLSAVEIWAAGSPSQMDKLMTQKAWELDQVMKQKNRKIEPDENWRESVDRQLLDMAGNKVCHSNNLPDCRPE
ncbi:hypothetical protein FBUS_09765, partial [Fasciolopsis buskii]